MNSLQKWHREMELKLQRVLRAQDAAKILNISHSYYTKISCGVLKMPVFIEARMSKILNDQQIN